MSIEVRLATTLPASIDPKSLRIVIRGAGKAGPGNMDYQNRSMEPVYSEAGLSTNLAVEFPVNGIVISRVPYTFPSDKIITNAPFQVKEDLARFVEAGYITVSQSGTALTADQIRNL